MTGLLGCFCSGGGGGAYKCLGIIRSPFLVVAVVVAVVAVVVVVGRPGDVYRYL